MEDGSTFTGSLGSRQVPSPLHAEFRTLLWAMSYALRMSHNKMHFEFSHLRSLFMFFSISFIPRELNSRADLLAKGVRAKGSVSSHVNILVPSGMLTSLPNLPTLTSLPSDLTPMKDLGEFMKELSQLESVSQKVAKLLDRLKELHERKIKRAAVRVLLDERQRILREDKLKLAEMKRLLAEGKKILAVEKKNLAEKKRKLNQRESHRDS
ncbi:hypothetical protein F2Q70_00022999 [Brassica cretica]|uniref:Uncharacterized protein n=1 Tax=Brassica cretica TaxID=69181 RepID=A0A8S9GNG0_BRACR|nr:hypothetical protein F2Q70_00022999 [Brassica cretica]